MTAPARVLLLDDSKIVLAVGRRLLESIGLTVHTIDSPAEFLSTLRSFKPDLVIIDVEMPAVDGPKLIDIARKHGLLQGVAVALHSSIDHLELSRLVRSCGAESGIQKTSDGGRFLAEIQAILKLKGDLVDRIPLSALKASLVPFPDVFLTGIDWMDRHHQLLYDAAVRLDRSIQAGEAASRIAETLGFLSSYSSFHFTAEERLMNAVDFPEKAKHEAAHVLFRATLDRFTVLMRRDGAAAPIAEEVRSYLAVWLRDHVNNHDKLIVAHLGQGPAQSAALRN